MTANESIKATDAEFKELSHFSGVEEISDSTIKHIDSGLLIEYTRNKSKTNSLLPNELYLYAEDNFDYAELPVEFTKIIGRILANQGKEYLECGISLRSDKYSPRSHGGTYIRFLQDGSIIEPISIWPTKKLVEDDKWWLKLDDGYGLRSGNGNLTWEKWKD